MYTVKIRKIVERSVFNRLMASAKRHGWTPAEVEPWGEEAVKATTKAAVWKVCDNYDEVTIYFSHADHQFQSGIVLTFGNSGYDLITDGGKRLLPVMDEVSAWVRETYLD